MPIEPTAEFSEYRRLILKELERLDETQKSLDATTTTIGKVLVRIETTLTAMDKRDATREEAGKVLALKVEAVERDMTAIKTKVAAFGAMAGLGAGGVMELVQSIL